MGEAFNNMKKTEKYIEIPGLEVARVNVVEIKDLKQITCLSRVVEKINPLKDYFGFKTCTYQGENYVILKVVTNSIPVPGANQNELVEVQLVPYDEFIKIPIKNKELIQFGIKKKGAPKLFIPNQNDEKLKEYEAEIEKLKAQINATGKKEEAKKAPAKKVETPKETDDGNK